MKFKNPIFLIFSICALFTCVQPASATFIPPNIKIAHAVAKRKRPMLLKEDKLVKRTLQDEFEKIKKADIEAYERRNSNTAYSNNPSNT